MPINYRKTEKLVKGFSNHRRIQIMELLMESSDLSLIDIAERLKINIKTASEHVRRLSISGIVLKKNRGVSVLHKLSPRGKTIVKFLKKFEYKEYE